MHKIIRRTLIALFSVICLVCGSLFIAACADDDNSKPNEPPTDFFSGKTIYNFADQSGFKLDGGAVTDLSGSDKDAEEQPYGNYTYNEATKKLTIAGSDYTLQDDGTLVIDSDIYYVTGTAYDVAITKGATTTQFGFTMKSVSKKTVTSMFGSETTYKAEFEDVTFGDVEAKSCTYEIDDYDDNVITVTYAADEIYSNQALIDLGAKTYTEDTYSATVYSSDKSYKAEIDMDSMARYMYLYKQDGADYVQVLDRNDDIGRVRRQENQTAGESTPETTDDVYEYFWTIENVAGTTVTQYKVTVSGVVFASNYHEDNYDDATLVVSEADSWTAQTVYADGDTYEIVVEDKDDVTSIYAFRIKAVGIDEYSTYYRADNVLGPTCESKGDKVFFISNNTDYKKEEYTITLTGTAGNYTATVDAFVASMCTGETVMPEMDYSAPYYSIGVYYNYTGDFEVGYTFDVVGIFAVQLSTESDPYEVVNCEKQPDGSFKVTVKKSDGDPFDLNFRVSLSGNSPMYPEVTAYVPETLESADGYKVTFAVAGGNASSVVAVSKGDVDYDVRKVERNSDNNFTVTVNDETKIYVLTVEYTPKADAVPASVTVTESESAARVDEVELTVTVGGQQVKVKLTANFENKTIDDSEGGIYWDDEEVDTYILVEENKAVYIVTPDYKLYLLTLGYDAAQKAFTATVNENMVMVSTDDGYYSLWFEANGDQIATDGVKYIFDEYGLADARNVTMDSDNKSFSADIYSDEENYYAVKFTVKKQGNSWDLSVKSENREIVINAATDGDYFYQLTISYDEIHNTLLDVTGMDILFPYDKTDTDRARIFIYSQNVSAVAGEGGAKTVNCDFGVYTVSVQESGGVLVATVTPAADSEYSVAYYYEASKTGNDANGYVAVIKYNSDNSVNTVTYFSVAVYADENFTATTQYVPAEFEAPEAVVTPTESGATIVVNGVQFTLTVTEGKLTVTSENTLIGSSFYDFDNEIEYTFVDATKVTKNEYGDETEGTYNYDKAQNKVTITFDEEPVEYTFDDDKVKLTAENGTTLYGVGENYVHKLTVESVEVEFVYELIDIEGYMSVNLTSLKIDGDTIDISGGSIYYDYSSEKVIISYTVLEDNTLFNKLLGHGIIALDGSSKSYSIQGAYLESYPYKAVVSYDSDSQMYAVSLFNDDFDMAEAMTQEPLKTFYMNADSLNDYDEFVFYYNLGADYIGITISGLDKAAFTTPEDFLQSASMETGISVTPSEETLTDGDYEVTVKVNSYGDAVYEITSLKVKGSTIELGHGAIIIYGDCTVTVIVEEYGVGTTTYKLTFTYGEAWSVSGTTNVVGA